MASSGIIVTCLKQRGYSVRGVDIKVPDYTDIDVDEFEILDLRTRENCLEATRGVDHVYALAADVGGMGFISQNHASILHNSALINLHTIEAARLVGFPLPLHLVACIYPEYRQTEANFIPLAEEDAYPAQPQDYGWEKLISEKLCEYYTDQYQLGTRP